MPLPNCGYFNKEEKKSQELVFEMPPEMVIKENNIQFTFATNIAFIQRSITLDNRLFLNVVRMRATSYITQQKYNIGMMVTYAKYVDILNIFY